MEEFSLDLTTRNDNGQFPPGGSTSSYCQQRNSGWQDKAISTRWRTVEPENKTLSWTIPQSIRDNFINNGVAAGQELFIVTNSGASGTLWVDNINAQSPSRPRCRYSDWVLWLCYKRRKA
jgi:hypothetical protein